jgi:K+-transporting ATPase ATPase B chain
MNVNALRVERPMSFLTRPIVSAAIRDSFVKLSPRVQVRNPVMFVVFIGSIFTTLIGIAAAAGLIGNAGHPAFVLAISAWLWLTVLFANFAEAVAEGRGKAQAATLRAMRQHVLAKRLFNQNSREHKSCEASALKRGDLVLVEANDIIPADGASAARSGR